MSSKWLLVPLTLLLLATAWLDSRAGDRGGDTPPRVLQRNTVGQY